MTLLTSTPTVDGILPDDYGQLVVQPLAGASLALQVTTSAITQFNTFNIPVITDDAAAAWVPEGGEIVADDVAFNEVVVVPTKVAGLCVLSYELAHDSSPAASRLVAESLARSLAKKLDEAFFAGLPAPAPPGLPSTTPTLVAAPVDYTNLDPFAEALNQAEAVGATLTNFVTGPQDALQIATLKTSDSANEPLLGSDATNATDRRILGVPLSVSPYVEAGVVWGIPKDRVVGVRDNGPRVERSEERYFESDMIAIKAALRVGFGFAHEAAIIKIERAAAV